MRNRIPLFLLLFTTLAFAQTTYYSTSGGAWTTSSNWSTVACGNGTNTGTYPQAGDIAVICHAIQITSSINVQHVTINPGGILETNAGGPYTINITGNLTLVSGGTLRHQNNSTMSHTLTIGGNLVNDGVLDLYYDANDVVSLQFTGATNSVVAGIAISVWDLYNVTINKSTKTTIVEVTTANFYSNFNGGAWTHTQGTYYHNNNATHFLGNGVNYTINPNSIVRVDNNGHIHFAYNAAMLTLQGRLEIQNATVTVGSATATHPHGIHYEMPGSIIPELIQHNGTLNVFQGVVNKANGPHPLAFSMYGGTMNLNLGTIPAFGETFKVNDIANSMFFMSGGNIHYLKTNSASASDFNVCGTAGSVSVTGGTVKFGVAGTPNNTIFRFTPYASATLPNFRVSGNAADSIIVKPSTTGNFKLMSLVLESKKSFDMSHNNNNGDSRTMTLTGTYDGFICFQDDNYSYADYFRYRNSTVIVEGTSAILVNGDQTYKPRFHNLRCAYAGNTTRLLQTTGVANVLYMMGGIILSNDGWQQLYLEGNNPLSITAGSDFQVESIKFNRWGGAQNIPAYTYNTRLVIAGHNNSTYMQGNITCNYLFVTGDYKSDRTSTFYSNNYQLQTVNDLVVGNPGATTNPKRFYAGNSNVTINGNYILYNDAEYYAEGSGMYLFGDWQNSAAAGGNFGFNQSNSTVIFAGGNTQLSCTNGPEDFYEIVMDKNAGNLTLQAAITVSNHATFTLGKLISSSTNHITLKYDCSHSGASSNSFVEGPLRYVGMNSLVFPIGRGTRYRPCTLYSTNSMASTDIHRAEYFDYSPDPPYNINSKDGVIGSVSTCEFWNLQNEAGSSSGRLRLTYGTGSCNLASYATFGVTRWDGAVWRDLGGTGGAGRTGDATAGSIETTVNTNYNGPYTIATEIGPSITADGPTTFCTGNTVTLTSSSGPSYLWSTGATTQSIVVNSSGSYTVTVSGMTSAAMVVSVISPPALPAATGIKVCNGTSGDITATGSTGNYRWYDASSGGTLLSSSNPYTTPNLSSTTTYYVAAANGSCESSTRTAVTATVVTKPSLTTNITNSFSCGGITLNALTSGVSNAIRLDGMDDHIAAPSGIYFNGNYTIEGWVNLKAHGNNQPLMDYGSVSNMVRIELSNSGTNRLRFVTYKGAAERSLLVPASVGQLTLNEWIHIACRIKDSTGTIFINGDSITSGLLYPGQNTVSNPAYIGRSVSGGNYTNADVDEFRIWNTARTLSEIKSGMLNSYPTGTPNIISYLRMDEGSGSITDDDVLGPNPALWGSPTWIFNGAPMDITYSWSPPSGLSATNTKTVLATPSILTNYTVQVTYLPGCSNSANITIDPATPGDTAVYGNNIWNVYGFNSKNFTNYYGYYTDVVVNLNSFSRWTQTSSPSSASGYQGCVIPVDSFSIKAKRKNFTNNTYQINVVQNDDQVQLFVDQVPIFSRAYSTSNVIVWVGTLNSLSEVEVRLIEDYGNAFVDINFSPTSAPGISGGSISGNQSLCASNDPAAFTSITPGAGCTIKQYQWQDSISGGAWTSIANATSLTYDPGALSQTTWYRRRVTDYCNAVAYSNVISITILPTVPPTITGTTTICENTSTMLTATGGGPDYEWYTVSSGGTSFYTGSSYTTPNLSNSTTYYVSSKNGACEGARTSVTISTIANPSLALAGSDQTICASTATLAANTPTTGTGAWSVISGTASVTTASSPTSGVTGLVTGSATLRWTISNAPCAASTDDVIITRVADPTTASAGSDQNVCASTATLAANTPTTGTGAWSVISGTASVTTASSPTSGVTGLVTGSATLRWTISNAPCAASTDDVIITRVADPTTAAAGSDQTICASTATLAANTPTTGTGAWSVISGTASVTTASSPTSGVTGLVTGSATLRWTISNAPCVSTTDDVIITRVADPTTANAGTDQNVCASTATLAANTPTNGTGAWSVISGTASVTTASSPTSGVTGLVTGSATLRWTISNAPCAASTDDVIITRAASPSVTIPAQCGGQMLRAETSSDSYALDFDGVSDQGQIPSVAIPAGDLTIESWVKLRSYNNWSALCDFSNGAGVDNIKVNLSQGTSGRPEFGIVNGTQSIVYSKIATIPLNEWTHIACVLSGTTGIIYINGRKVAVESMNTPTNVVRTMNYLGRTSYGTDNSNVLIDQFRVWSIARSEAQINTDMNAELPGATAGLMMNFTANEGTGATSTDITSAHVLNLSGVSWINTGAPVGLTYAWTPAATLSNATDWNPYPNSMVSQTYKVVVTTINGCKDSSTVNVTAVPGDTAVYGNNTWNFYGFDSENFNNYQGYFSSAPLSFDTETLFDKEISPSVAAGYSGCSIGNHFSVSARRTNFTPGVYTIDINGHDDDLEIRLDGATIFVHNGCCDSHPAAWTGCLGPTSELEIRLQNRYAGGFMNIGFTSQSFTPGSISAPQTICKNTTPAAFTSVTPTNACQLMNYQWQDSIVGGSWTNIAAATAETYAPPALSQTTWFRRKVTDSYLREVISNSIEITVNDPGTPVVSDVSICSGYNATFTASGSTGTYRWYDAASGGTLLSSSNPYSVLATVSDSVYVTAVFSGCESPRVLAKLLVSGNAPDVSFLQPTYCANDILQPSVNGFSGSITLDGTSSHVQIPSATYFSGDFTMEAWVYLDRFTNGQRLLDFGNGNFDNNVLMTLDGNFDQRIVVYVYNGANYTRMYSSNGVNPYLNNWFHVAYAQQGTTGRIYINGELSATKSGMYVPTNIVRNSNYIGRSNWLTEEYTQGKLDEIRIWNIARTQGEIQGTMMNEISPATPGLQNYWNCNETSGTVLNDLVSGNNGNMIAVARNTFGAPLGLTYSWTPTTSLSAPNALWTKSNPAIVTNYQVVVSNGACKDSATISVNPAPPGIDTANYGNGEWHSYVFQGFNFDALHGIYSQASLNFDSRTSYDQAFPPSTATGYNGCDVTQDYHSQLVRRTNFTEGIYRIDIGGHDDYLRILMDSDTIFYHKGCCDIHNNVWIGKLKPSTKLDFQIRNRLGLSYLFFTLNPDSPPPLVAGTISANQTLCGFQIPDTLRNVSLATGCSNIRYQWQDSSATSADWNDIVGATDTFYVSGGISETTWFRRVATDACEQTSYSNIIEITIDIPAAPTALDRSICSAGTIVLVAKGGTNYRWYDAPGGGTLLSSDDTLSIAIASTTTYYVAALSGIGCEGPRTPVQAQVLGAAPGDPLVFGANVWNVYAYDGNNFGTYMGYFTEPGINIATSANYAGTGSPSDAINYNGCIVAPDSHSVSFKRSGFPDGVYRIDIPMLDDQVELWIDGVKVFSDTNALTAHYKIWQGTLSTSSSVELRLIEDSGTTELQVQFIPVIAPLDPARIFDISKDTLFCVSGDPLPFQSGLTLEPLKDAYVFESDPTQNYGADAFVHMKNSGPGVLDRYGFMAFDIQDASTPIQSAILQLAVRLGGGSERQRVLGVYELDDNTWSETGINYTNYPAKGNLIDTMRIYRTTDTIELDVSAYVEAQRLAGKQVINFAFEMLSSASAVIIMDSREGPTPPKLILNKSVSPCNLQVRWQYNIGCNSTWFDIGGATSDDFDHSTVTEKTCYRKYIFDACGRSDTSNIVTVDIDSSSIAGVISGNTTICAGAGTEILSLTGLRGSPVEWEVSTDNFVYTSTGTVVTSYTANNVPDTTWIRAIVKNGVCDADTSATFRLDAIRSEAGILQKDTAVCLGTTLHLSIAGHTGSILDWESSSDGFNNGTPLSTTATTYNATINQATQFRVLVQNGTCPSDTSNVISITLNPSVSLVISDPPSICAPASVDITAPSITAGSSTGLTLTYWQDATATVSESNPTAITNAGTYYIRAVNANQCSDTQAVNVLIEAVPNVVVTDPAATCLPYGVDLTSATVTAGSDPALTYSYWTDNTASTPLANPADVVMGGTYYILGTTAGGCPGNILPVAVVVNAAPSYSIPSEVKVLKGNHSLIISISGHSDPVTEWQLSTSNFSTIDQVISGNTNTQSVINLTDSTWYRVILGTSTCGNYPTSPVLISVFNPMQFFVPDTIQVYINSPYSSTSSLLDKISFQDPYLVYAAADTSLTFQAGTMAVNSTGMFVYTPASGYLGLDSASYQLCTADLNVLYCETQTIYFRINPLPVTPGPIVVYTSFSPNEDGVNDSWIIDNIEYFPNNTVRILDRWGGIVFEEKGYDNLGKVWKGNGKKGPLPNDTYYYVLEIDNKIEKSGFVVLKK